MTPTARRTYHHGDLRASLLRAAEQQVRSHGAADVSLRELARELGVSHAAPRRHFSDRQDLLDALAVVGFERLGDHLRAAVAGVADDEFAPRLREAALAFTRFATQHGALLELMNTAKHRSLAPDVRGTSEATFRPMADLIEQGQAEGVLADGDPERIGLIIYATLNGIAMLANAAALDVADLESLTRTAVDQFVRGAGPPTTAELSTMPGSSHQPGPTP